MKKTKKKLALVAVAFFVISSFAFTSCEDLFDYDDDDDDDEYVLRPADDLTDDQSDSETLDLEEGK